MGQFSLTYQKNSIAFVTIYSLKNGMPLPALKLITDYFQNRKQRTKIGSIYSDWEDIISGVPQGSILGPLLFNIFLCDLFLEDENNYFANYADDTIPYSVGSTTTEV